MRARNWAVIILVNVVVSALTMLTVLIVWNRSSDPAPVIPTAAGATAEIAETTPTGPSATTPTSSGPKLYVVQEGDTLGGIAQAHGVTVDDLIVANGLTDPNVLQVGQSLIIPESGFAEAVSGSTVEAPASPGPTALPTLTPSGPPLVEIGQVLGSGDLTSEVVVVRNRGGVTDLEGWVLSDGSEATFLFPALTLFADTQVRVHSTAGSSTPTDLYWGREEPAWNGGELITLRDAAGNVVDTYVVP